MSRWLGIVAALAVAALRCLVHPPANPALDPVVILCALWIAIALAPRERAADAAVVAASLLTPAALGIAGAAALAALLAGGAHRRLPRWRDPGAGPVILVIFGLVALRLLAQAWVFAPYIPDVLSYNLPKVAEWVRAGALT